PGFVAGCPDAPGSPAREGDEASRIVEASGVGSQASAKNNVDVGILWIAARARRVSQIPRFPDACRLRPCFTPASSKSFPQASAAAGMGTQTLSPPSVRAG